MPKYVLFYESADDVRSRAPQHFAAHVARWKEFQVAGTLLMVGTFANPQDEGSMAIFTTREAAEAFAKDDRFVLNGVVRHWSIREWNEAIAAS
ncbi:MAG TPA: YciI family protein [Candidatus Dormibacteraeota bacterium]|nr:YciI family protein [Candidatus Dormibacteraeota bacterium]